jgi:hypothetical protein
MEKKGGRGAAWKNRREEEEGSEREIRGRRKSVVRRGEAEEKEWE